MKIPTKPEVGQVIRYGYVWHREHARGQENARKDRPCAVVLTVDKGDSGITTLVVPITHTEPRHDVAAIKLPLATGKRLGLDAAQSWVVVSELNMFIWPGFDLAEVECTGSPVYGYLPPALYDIIKRRALEEMALRRVKSVRR